MRVRNWIFIGVVIIVLMLTIVSTRNTFAYSYEIDDSVLFFDYDQEVLEENIKKYLEDLDDLLIVNSRFELSDLLVENYDFLVYFALDYVLMYHEIYRDILVEKDIYYYVNRDLETLNTNLYISLEEIYKITDQYFGVRDFQVVNADVLVIDDYISLVDYTKRKFSLDIERVQVSIQENYVLATVYYENDVCYLYTFENQNNVLKIRNIEVLS